MEGWDGLPLFARDWQKWGEGRGCGDLPEICGNGRREGAAANCQRLVELKGGKRRKWREGRGCLGLSLAIKE